MIDIDEETEPYRLVYLSNNNTLLGQILSINQFGVLLVFSYKGEWSLIIGSYSWGFSKQEKNVKIKFSEKYPNRFKLHAR